MNHKILVLLVLTSLSCVNPNEAGADIVNFTESGITLLQNPPTSVRRQQLVSDTKAFLFEESTGVLSAALLPNILAKNVTLNSPLYNPADEKGFRGAISAGMGYTSYYLHFDTTFNLDQIPLPPILVSGSVTFDQDILGIITLADRTKTDPDYDGLAETDLPFGSPTTAYPLRTEFDHDLDFEGAAANSLDILQLSNNYRTLEFAFKNTGLIDAARIIVANPITPPPPTIPEPSSLLLLSSLGVPMILLRTRPGNVLQSD